MKKRRMTRKTLLEIIAFSRRDIHIMNTVNVNCYCFTLDRYNGKNTWCGEWCNYKDEIENCKHYEYMLKLNPLELTKW